MNLDHVMISFPKRNRRRRGMSLMEAMVTIMIIVTLGSVVGYFALSNLSNANSDMASLQMQDWGKQIQIYTLRKGKPPADESELRTALNIKDGKEMPKDPWGNAYVYSAEGEKGYELTSLGEDGAPGGEGNDADIKLSELKK